jgi:hypothetical protein
MKSLKILFVVLLVVSAFVACEKSNVKPHSCSHSSSQSQPAPNDQPVNGRIKNSAPSSTVTVHSTSTPDEIVGGGDDDRDGGDRKTKTAGK